MPLLRQTTIAKPIEITGIGVHSGLASSIKMKPLAANMGIIFERTDIKEDNQIFASIENVVDTRGATTLSNDSGVVVSTIEHLMAALAAFNITNILICIDSRETPIMDGSSAPFIEAINKAGTLELDAPQKVLTVTRPVEIIDENRWVRLEPRSPHPNSKDGAGDGFADEPGIEFDIFQAFNGREGLKDQQHSIFISSQSFSTDISKARSFGFYEDAQKLYAAGLAKGSSLENAVVFKDGEVMNPDGLRYENEMVRHKILDAVGDFFLCGYPMDFKCSGSNIGHELNNLIMRKLLSTPDAFELRTFPMISGEAKKSAIMPSLVNSLNIQQNLSYS